MTDTDVTASNQTNKGVNEVGFKFGPWTINARKSHIIQSKCATPDRCGTGGRSPSNASATAGSQQYLCTVCRYSAELLLPQLPDMVFADNCLCITHTEGGFGLGFNTLDALKLVDAKRDLMKVAVADAWREARADSEYLKDVVKPFDWTFTTRYKGTLYGEEKFLKVTETNEKIDVEKLKQREKILFYEDVHLFEDELADNGCAEMSVKIIGTDYLLREFSVRESNISDLHVVPSSILTDANEVWTYLTAKEECTERLEIPAV